MLKLVESHTRAEKVEHDLMIKVGRRLLEFEKGSLLAIVNLPTGEGSPLNE